MFEPLPAQFNFPEAEERILAFWEQHGVFQKSLDQRRGAPRFVFYEGPPTANGLPHPGHCLTRAIKDLFPRYQTMCGKLVERKAGWDTHGLPVEVEVCKELGIHTKEEIENYGVEKFIRKCIESVFRYTREWEQMTRRLGFWVNLEEAYVTYHQSYVESVWWGLKTLFERGLLYQGHKVVWWWAQGGTALSAGEVGEGYRTVQDPAVFVRFRLDERAPLGARDAFALAEPPDFIWKLVQNAEQTARIVDSMPTAPDEIAKHLVALRFLCGLPDELRQDDDDNGLRTLTLLRERGEEFVRKLAAQRTLLVWTTTPWTLVSNHFAAVGPDVIYSLVYDAVSGESLYIASALVNQTAERSKRKLEVLGTCKGERLLGLRYIPPFDAYYKSLGSQSANLKDGMPECLAWRTVLADFIDLETGTGIVHIAPAYGEVDFELLQTERRRFTDELNSIPLLNAVAPNGTFTNEAPAAYRGRWVKDCDKDIIRELRERGILYHQETIEHEYPFCPRAEDDPLIQYARKSWFVRTSQFKEEFLKNNASMNWLPGHIQEGRFGDFLRNNVDWALSRERWWGTPLPIWVCEKTGQMEAVGSYAELLAKPGVTGLDVWEKAKAADPSLPEHLKVHKPYIDEITYDSPFVGEAAGGTGVPPVGAGQDARTTQKARMCRVPEVIDCWWDAGSMPFAQWGFPHVPGSVQMFTDRFPSDFISEAIDQTRGWFYGLLAISTLLFKSGGTGVPPVLDEHTAHEPASAASERRSVGPELGIRRRYLPHWEAGGSTYFVTFRARSGELAPAERELVFGAARYFDGTRYLLHAAVAMPDHVHLLMTPLEKSKDAWWALPELLHSIKSFSAKEINHLRGHGGPVWMEESFDRIIRSEADFNEKLNYILTNAERRGFGADYAWVCVEPTHGPKNGRDARTTRAGAVSADYPHPYKTCIVLGHVMGEDALKMSKRTKNYKDPSYIFDHYGADAMRWYFFSAQAPWTSVRFQEANIRDAQREFLVRLYNVFSFFNIYANIDRFEPRRVGTAHQSETVGDAHPTSWRPVPQRAELDRWIISELHATIRDVRAALDGFENYPAAGRLNHFVDALSNWYVRRSRDRFWRPVAAGAPPAVDVASAPRGRRSEPEITGTADQDKWDAYNTLYEVLLTLSKLVAPFTPFFAELMYQNLTRQSDEGPLSVHLCDYPVADEALIDDALTQEMDLVRDIVSLGRAARTAAKLKVRQPLALVEIILARREHMEWLQAHSALIAEELNIKQVEFASEAEHYVTYQIKADFKAIGPKFGKLAKQVAAALNTLDAATARKSLADTGEIAVLVDGQPTRLTAQEVEVRLEAKPGWSAAQGRAGVVVVKTELTDELRDEGLCRELIHQVQELRKNQQLPYEARVTLYVDGPPRVLDVARRFSATIESECLAATIELTAAPPGTETQAAKIDGHEVKLSISRM